MSTAHLIIAAGREKIRQPSEIKLMDVCITLTVLRLCDYLLPARRRTHPSLTLMERRYLGASLLSTWLEHGTNALLLSIGDHRTIVPIKTQTNTDKQTNTDTAQLGEGFSRSH